MGAKAEHSREAVVAGRFYSKDPLKLGSELEELFSAVAADCPPDAKSPRALISPHAGYVFSGEVAASAFSCIPADTEYDNIFLIGSSHSTSFPSASVYCGNSYQTPLGRVKVNNKLASRLTDEYDCFQFLEEAHLQEHSLEVQLPFLQHRLKNEFGIVPILIGERDSDSIKKIAKALLPWFNKDNLFIISTDLSHYPSYTKAVESDKRMIEAVLSGEPEKLIEADKYNMGLGISGLLTTMCGFSAVLCLMYMAESDQKPWFRKIKYMNSGDSTYGDWNRVVGYVSMMLG